MSISGAPQAPADPVLDLVLETTMDAVIVMKADGTVAEWNAHAEMIFGRSRAEAVGRELAQLIIPKKYRGSHRRGLKKYLETGRGRILRRRIEVTALKADGSEFPVELTISPVERGGGVLFLGFLRDITDEVDAQRSLADSRARLALASTAAALGIWDWDVVGNRMIYSDRAKEIFGFPPDKEVTYQQVRDATHPEDLPRTSAMARQALDPNVRLKMPYDYRIVRPDGEVRWVLAHGEAVFGEAGGETKALRYVGTIQDVTEARLTERSLRESEARLRLALGAARMAVWELDLRSDRVIDPSPELKRMLGVPEDHDVDLESTRTRYAPGERERIRAEMLEQLQRGDDFLQSDFRYFHPDGNERHFSLRATVEFGEDRQPSRVVGVLVDVTQQKQAEAALRESEQRRQRAQEAGGIGDWVLDIATDQLTFSEQFARLMGRRRSQMPRKAAKLIPLIQPDDFRGLRRKLAALRAGREKKLDAEYRVILPDGNLRWLASRAEGERDEQGELVRIAGVSFDITPRRQAEETVRRMNETLEAEVARRTAELEGAYRKLQAEAAERERIEQVLRQAQKMEAMGQLTGGVAHDFNNLLMAVLGNLDLLSRAIPHDDKTDRYLNGAIQGAKRGAALTQRLLAFARQQELHVTPVDLAALISGMADLLEKSIGPGIETRFELPQGLPPALADPNQVELALLNLVVNARDAMPEGGRLTIALSRETRPPDGASGEFVRLSVADTGAGMTEDVLKRAIEPFFSTKEVGKGTGLGLSMTHGLAEQLGGKFLLHSEPGKGTRAELWLPVASAADDPAHAEREQAPASAARPLTVLFVDDDALVAMGTIDMLEDLGHRVFEANSGARALEILREEPGIDLLITDHSMPGMTGVQLARAARELRPDLPILLATGYADIPNGADLNLPRLPKPFLQEQLAAEIGKLMGVGQ